MVRVASVCKHNCQIYRRLRVGRHAGGFRVRVFRRLRLGVGRVQLLVLGLPVGVGFRVSVRFRFRSFPALRMRLAARPAADAASGVVQGPAPLLRTPLPADVGVAQRGQRASLEALLAHVPGERCHREGRDRAQVVRSRNVQVLVAARRVPSQTQRGRFQSGRVAVEEANKEGSSQKGIKEETESRRQGCPFAAVGERKVALFGARFAPRSSFAQVGTRSQSRFSSLQRPDCPRDESSTQILQSQFQRCTFHKFMFKHII